MERFDAIVIGTGQAGPALATKLAGSGLSVAIVERKFVGGTCVNVGTCFLECDVGNLPVVHGTGDVFPQSPRTNALSGRRFAA